MEAKDADSSHVNIDKVLKEIKERRETFMDDYLDEDLLEEEQIELVGINTNNNS